MNTIYANGCLKKCLFYIYCIEFYSLKDFYVVFLNLKVFANFYHLATLHLLWKWRNIVLKELLNEYKNRHNHHKIQYVQKIFMNKLFSNSTINTVKRTCITFSSSSAVVPYLLKIRAKVTFGLNSKDRYDQSSVTEMTSRPKVVLPTPLLELPSNSPGTSGRFVKWAIVGVVASILGYWALRQFG